VQKNIFYTVLCYRPTNIHVHAGAIQQPLGYNLYNG